MTEGENEGGKEGGGMRKRKLKTTWMRCLNFE